MKVRNVGGLDAGLNAPKGLEHATGGADKAVVFQRALSDLTMEAQDAHVMALVAEIDKQGQKLSKRADVRELERYRALIKQFIDQIVSNGYAFSKENSFASRGRHRLFATINIVNQKLDELGRQVLSDQSDNLKILDMVDDIRGLLMDMML